MEIQYLVIYSLDISKQSNYTIGYFKPDTIKYPRWTVTEDKVEEIEYSKQHRKYVGLLTAKKLEEFLDSINSIVGTCDTMGSITLEYGWLPAVSFETENSECWECIYVSPVIPFPDPGYKPSDLVIRNFHNKIETEILGALKNIYPKDGYPNNIDFNFNQLVCL